MNARQASAGNETGSRHRAIDYVGELATALWTVGWIVTARVATDRFLAIPDTSAVVAVLVAEGMAALGGSFTFGLLGTPKVRIRHSVRSEKPASHQSWSRSIKEW